MRAVAQPRTARGLPNPAGFRGRPADPALRDIADLGLSKGESECRPRNLGNDDCGGAHLRANPRRLYLGQLSRSEEHTSELQSLMRISYAVFCLKKKTILQITLYRKRQEKN